MMSSPQGRALAQTWSVAVLSVLTLAACQPKEKPMDLAEVEEFAVSYTAAWCSQKPESVAEHFAENGSLQINDGAPSVGRAAITAAAADFMIALPDLVVAMDGISAEGTRFVYHWTLTGTDTGPGGTGNTVHISGYEEWTFGADGLIAESEGHFDAAEYERQLHSGVGGS